MQMSCRHGLGMQTIPRRRLIGVLGGMGPAATIDFMAKIVMLTPAASDQEHVPLLVHDVPQIPDRSSAIAAGSDAPFLPMLAGLMQLARGGAEIIAIPCNTAHHWHERLARSCGVPLIHIADAVVEMLAEQEAPPARSLCWRPAAPSRPGSISRAWAGAASRSPFPMRRRRSWSTPRSPQ